MASRERETAVVGAAAAKPSELRGSAFRRADFYEERQIPGPRRFGFGGTSPPRRNHYDQQQQLRPSPPRTANYHHDTPRQTILPSRGSPSSPSLGSRGSLLSPPRPLIGSSNDVRALLNDMNGGQTDVAVEETSPTTHPVFSQLALVLGFELAKKVTARHPRETDLNRLANLALDITVAPGVPVAALEAAAAVSAPTSAPSRSASTTSAASTHSLQEQRSAVRRGSGVGGGHFNRPSGNRSPQNEQRRYGGGRSVRSSLGGSSSGGTAGRTRANSAASAATDDSFVTAVSAATAAAAAVPPSPAPSSPPQTVVSDESADVRTDVTAVDDNDDDLIDWDGEMAAPEEQIEAVPSARSTVECAPHLLD